MNIKKTSNNLVNFIKNIPIKRILIILLSLVAVIGIGGSYYFYTKYSAIKERPDLEAQKETQSIISMAGELIELPQGEIPTVATISDKEKLKDQTFFKTAANGDILLAYTTAMQAILYRPSTNKIINVAPITIDQQKSLEQGTTQNASATADRKYTITYYNGTKVVGAALLTENLVKATYKDYVTKSIANAARNDYAEAQIIDISGTHPQESAELAKLLKGKVVALPQGEAAPSSDFLIISGK
jgi:hypothetical protein